MYSLTTFNKEGTDCGFLSGAARVLGGRRGGVSVNHPRGRGLGVRPVIKLVYAISDIPT